MGVPFVEDINDPSQPILSITKLRTTVAANGTRSTTCSAFLPKTYLKAKPNLKVCLGVIAQRLEIVSERGRSRVAGVYVEPEKSNGKTFFVRAKEIVLCCGAVGSPQLLLLRYSPRCNFLTNIEWRRPRRTTGTAQYSSESGFAWSGNSFSTTFSRHSNVKSKIISPCPYAIESRRHRQ